METGFRQRADDDALIVDALCGSPDGRTVLRAQARGPASAARALGLDVAEQLLAAGADALLHAPHP